MHRHCRDDLAWPTEKSERPQQKAFMVRGTFIMHYSGKRSGYLSHHGVIRDTGLIHTMCHHAVADPYLSGSNGIWKKKVSY